jgi:hypothetical protein
MSHDGTGFGVRKIKGLRVRVRGLLRIGGDGLGEIARAKAMG